MVKPRLGIAVGLVVAVIAASGHGQDGDRPVQDQWPIVDRPAIEADDRDGDFDLPGIRYVIFASLSLPAPALETMAALAASRDDTVMAFRGIGAGDSIGAFAARLQAVLGDVDSVIIDPRPFRVFEVERVPAIADLAAPAVAHGVYAPDWIADRVASGRHGQFGSFGATVTIGEPDLVDLIAARARGLDWQALRQRSIDSLWSRARLLGLPAAQETTTRTLDAGVRVTRTIRDHTGAMIVPRGTVIDPFEILPFHLSLVVFDGRDPVQVAWVEGQLASGLWPRPVLMLSGIDRNQGWAGFNALQERLGHPILLLTPEIAERFGVRAVPTTIHGENRRFVIREFALSDEESG